MSGLVTHAVVHIPIVETATRPRITVFEGTYEDAETFFIDYCDRDDVDEFYVMLDEIANRCEGCAHCIHPGIRWPASPDGDESRSYVDRCDYCERYESDEDATKLLAEHYGVRWGYGERFKDGVRWAPPLGDGLNYTGWSTFIEHPARDGDRTYYVER